MISPVVCSNSDDYSALVILASGKVVAGQTPLYEIKGARLLSRVLPQRRRETFAAFFPAIGPIILF